MKYWYTECEKFPVECFTYCMYVCLRLPLVEKISLFLAIYYVSDVTVKVKMCKFGAEFSAKCDLLTISLKFVSKVWKFRDSLNQFIKKCPALLAMHELCFL